MFAALGGFLFLNSLYLQDVRGLSALQTGMGILPAALAVTIVSPTRTTGANWNFSTRRQSKQRWSCTSRGR